MIPFLSRALGFATLVFGLVVGAPAAEPEIIAKARAFLGSEAALNAVKSVHYVGSVSTVDPADPAKQSRASIDIIAQKPEQQRVLVKSDTAIETTALDGYEGWQRTQDLKEPKNQRHVVFRPDAVKKLRAQAWENLSFYRGIEQRGGRIEDQGLKDVDGVKCHKLAFIYSPNIIFYRYFDAATGRLVQTETEDGGITREDGERVVNGVRFPTSMKMTVKGPKGHVQTVSISFDTIAVNETFPPEVFRVPRLETP